MPTSPRDPDKLEEIGQRLARTREALGRTQDELAAELGVSRTALAGWELGRTLPDALAMTRLKARHLVPLDWIYAGSGALLPKHIDWLADDQPNPTAARRRG